MTKLITTPRAFLSPQEQFDEVEKANMPADEARIFDLYKHSRREFVYPGKKFVVYEMGHTNPKVLDVITVDDFDCNNVDGASTRLLNREGKDILVGYTPTMLFQHPVFVFLPIEMRINFNARHDDHQEKSLSFGLVLRTKSRISLSERKVTYCESREVFIQEFGNEYGV